MKSKFYFEILDQKQLNACKVNGIFGCCNEMQSFILKITDI